MEKKKLFLTIKGVQKGFGQEEQSEIAIAADYFQKEDRHYLFYSETTEDGIVLKNRLTMEPNIVELKKSGGGHSLLRFRQGYEEPCVYQSPAGPLHMVSKTKRIHLDVTHDRLKLQLEYSFFTSGMLVSEYTLTVEGKPLPEK